MRPHLATLDDLTDLKTLLDACGMDSATIDAQVDPVLVVRDMSGLIGCACAKQYGAIALLKAIAVSQHVRCAGLGELLLNALVAEFRQRGVHTLVLHPKGAIRFFTRLGFTFVDRADIAPLRCIQNALEGGEDAVMQATL